MTRSNDLTHKHLIETLDYNPETGHFSWKVDRKKFKAGDRAGFLDGGYRKIALMGFAHKEHRLAWFYVHGKWPKKFMDHINGVRSDNRLCNLREATRQENGANIGLKSHNTSGYKGVSLWKKTGKWKAQIQVKGKKIFLGYHDTPREAYEAFIFGALEHHGEFARFE